MERMWTILGVLAALYAAYALSLKKWNYQTEAQRAQKRAQWKTLGLSDRYYFIPARRLLLLNLLSGGVFMFYWAYQQWRAVLGGFKSAAGRKLFYGPVLRALFIFISFYQLNAILNRTALYLRKTPTLAAWWWGTALWAGVLCAALPWLPPLWRVAGAACALAAPYALQARINALPKETPPSRLKKAELLWTAAGWLVWGAVFFLIKMR